MSNFKDVIKYNSLPCEFEEQRKLAESDLGHFINQVMNCDYDYDCNYNESPKKVIKVYTWQYEGVKIYIKWLLDTDSTMKSLSIRSTTIDNVDAPTPFSTSGYRSINHFYSPDDRKLNDEEIEKASLEMANEMIPRLSDKKELKQFEKDLKELNKKNREGFEKEKNPYKPYDNKRDYLESFLFEKYQDQFNESLESWWKDYFLKFALNHGYDYPGIEKDCDNFNEPGIVVFRDFDRAEAGMHGAYRKYFIDVIKNKPERFCLFQVEELDFEIEGYKEIIKTKSDIYKLSPEYYDLAIKLKGRYANDYLLQEIMLYVLDKKMGIREAYNQVKIQCEKYLKKEAIEQAKYKDFYDEPEGLEQQELFA